MERRSSLASQVNILNSQIAQQQQELAGRDRQRNSLTEQLASVTGQMKNVRPLLGGVALFVERTVRSPVF